MNNLHRELAPVSGAAWAQIEEEAARTLKQYLSARRVVDVPPPKGPGASAVGTGHVQNTGRRGTGGAARGATAGGSAGSVRPVAVSD